MTRKAFPFFLGHAVLFLTAAALAEDGRPAAPVDEAAVSVWDAMIEVVGDGYRLSVPSAWRAMDMRSYGLAEYFEASGRLLPAIHDGAPVIVTVFLTSFGADSLERAKDGIIGGYTQNPDRVFPDGFSHEEREFSLSGMRRAYLLKTRFYRRSKGLHQSRYDLIAFSSQSRRAFVYTLSVQYLDGSYAFEDDYQLESVAGRLFSNFQLD